MISALLNKINTLTTERLIFTFTSSGHGKCPKYVICRLTLTSIFEFPPLLLFIIYIFRTICVYILRKQFASFCPVLQKMPIYLFSSVVSFPGKKITSGYLYMPSAVNNSQKILQFMYCESDKL